MNREEAIAIIRKEYLCVDRDCDIEKNCGKCDLMMPSKEPILEAYKMAIKALEQMPVTTTAGEGGVIYYPQVEGVTSTVIDVGKQEPCEDLISRQAVLDIVDNYSESRSNVEDITQDMISDILALPPVTPQPKTGHWIFDEILDKHYYCSECKSMGVDYWDFCPNCGAKMVEPQESEDKDADKKCTYKETGCGSCKRQLDCPIEADTAERTDT